MYIVHSTEVGPGDLRTTSVDTTWIMCVEEYEKEEHEKAHRGRESMRKPVEEERAESPKASSLLLRNDLVKCLFLLLENKIS
eukprot:13896_6